MDAIDWFWAILIAVAVLAATVNLIIYFKNKPKKKVGCDCNAGVHMVEDEFHFHWVCNKCDHDEVRRK